VSWYRFQKNGCKNTTSLQLGWRNMHRKAHTPPILEKGSVKHVQITRCTQEPDQRWVELVEKSQRFRLGSRRIVDLLGVVEVYFFDAFGFGIEVQNLGSDQCRCLQSHWEPESLRVSVRSRSCVVVVSTVFEEVTFRIDGLRFLGPGLPMRCTRKTHCYGRQHISTKACWTSYNHSGKECPEGRHSRRFEIDSTYLNELRNQ